MKVYKKMQGGSYVFKDSIQTKTPHASSWTQGFIFVVQCKKIERATYCTCGIRATNWGRDELPLNATAKLKEHKGITLMSNNY
jgi:hypothetical protein